MNIGDLKDLAEYKKLLLRNLANVTCILDEKSVAMAKDWAWADLSYSVEDLKEMLK